MGRHKVEIFCIYISHRVVLGIEEHHDVLLAFEGPQGDLSSTLVLRREVWGIGANLHTVGHNAAEKRWRQGR